MKPIMTKALCVKDIADGQMKTITVGSVSIAIACVNGSYFAISDRCTHAECSLGTEGYIDGESVMCGCHGATFDLHTGKVLTLPATVDVTSYPIEVKDGWIYIEV
jgi:nitrite reductase/ring-hydroxylating ferredoxin subunit